MKKNLRINPVIILVIVSLLLTQAGVMVGAAAPASRSGRARPANGWLADPTPTGPVTLDPTPGEPPALGSVPEPGQKDPSVQLQAGSIRPVNIPAVAAALKPEAYAAGWNTLMSETFEGAFPTGMWTTYDFDGATNGDFAWGADDYWPYSGLLSAWPAKGGTNGVDPNQYYYPKNLNSWMVYGPFSLAGMSDAKLQFEYWNSSEPGKDIFKWLASTDGSLFYGYTTSGESNGWIPVNFDLTSVPTLGNLAGDASVWIAFQFTSDAQDVGVTGYDGPFVDDIVLQGFVAATQPDLAPYTPVGWDFPIVPASVTGTTTVGALNPGLTYVDMAIINNGMATTASTTNCLYYDNAQVNCFSSSGLGQGAVKTITDLQMSVTPSGGAHVLKLVADVNNAVAEANESNNTWEHTFIWAITCPNASHSYSPDSVGGSILQDARSLPPEVQKRIQQSALSPAGEGSPSAPGYYDTSAFLEDSVAVGIVLPESAGSMEDWTDTEIACVVQKIQAGMDWWKTRGGARANLSFQYDVRSRVPISAEPIDLSDSQQEVWVGQSLTSMGMSGTDAWDQAYNYLGYLRSTYHTKWATVIFVADSSNDPDGLFRDSQYFAWAYIGGPFIIMTLDNDGWGLGDMNWVAAHEFGHIFWAADQYYQPGYGGCTSTTERYGYLGIANSNCQNGNPNSVASIMRSNENALDTGAAGQIGWLDSNGNGINDVVDTRPVIALNHYSTDPILPAALTYNGSVTDKAWPHAVCGVGNTCQSKDLNINTIASVNYRVNGGAWANATALDGTFNSDVESFKFTTSTLTDGEYTIEVKATNTRGVSTSWTDTVIVSSASCHSLTTSVNPADTGTVRVLTSPNCETSANDYSATTRVSLSAVANPGYAFSSWSGSLTGANPNVTIGMGVDRHVTANFVHAVPAITSLSPNNVDHGRATFTLTVTGHDFLPCSVVRWNGLDLVTLYVSATELTATVPSGLITKAGVFNITTFTPAPGGGSSGFINFYVKPYLFYLPDLLK